MCCCVDAPGADVGIDVLSSCPIISPLQLLFPLLLSSESSRSFSRRAKCTKTCLKRFGIVRSDTKCTREILVLVLGYVGISAFFHEHGFSRGLAFDSVCKPLKLVAFAVCVSENFAFTVCTRNRVLSGRFPLFDVGSLCATFVCATASPQQQRPNGSATETCMSGLTCCFLGFA